MSSTDATAHAGHGRTASRARLGRTLAVFVPVFFLGTFITFALRSLSGLSPAHLQLGESATPEKVAAARDASGASTSRSSCSTGTGSPASCTATSAPAGSTAPSVSTLIGLGRAVISLSIAGLALVIGVVGRVRARHRSPRLRQTTWVDRAITGFTTVISVMPAFVVGIVLVAVFAVALGWFPSAGYVPIGAGRHARGSSTSGCRPWRSASTPSPTSPASCASGLIAAYRENYVTGAVVRGLSPRRIFFVHVLRNGVGPALTVLGLKFPTLLGGAVVTESIFGLAGLRPVRRRLRAARRRPGGPGRARRLDRAGRRLQPARQHRCWCGSRRPRSEGV